MSRLSTIAAIALTFVIMCPSLSTCSNEMSLAIKENRVSKPSLQRVCPSESSTCHTGAYFGRCWGDHDHLESYWRRCPCSCQHAATHRMQQCCWGVSDGEREDCIELCKYGGSVDDLFTEKALSCISKYVYLSYCTSEGNDVTNCCKSSGVSKKCLPFCVGKRNPFACGDVQFDTMASCAKYTPKIQMCMLRGLDRRQMTWKKQWRPTDSCDALGA